MQVAGVKKPLASVRKMCAAGNRVVFEDTEDDLQGGYVQNKTTGVKIPITKEGAHGTYEVNLWTKTLKKEDSGGLDDLDEDEEQEEEGKNSSSSTSFRRLA